MNGMRKCIPRWPRISFIAALFVVLAPHSPLFAQTARIVDRLSSDTFYYMEWRGMAVIANAEKKNHVLQLFEDPDFMPVRQALTKSFQTSMAKQGSKTTPPEISDLLSLLDNSVVMGFSLSSAPPKASDSGSVQPQVGFFIVYDATGKTALIERLKAANKETGTEVPTVMNYDFGGTSVEVKTTGNNASYTARAAQYYIFADQKEAIEDLITRFRPAEKPAKSVTQLPEYKEIQSYIGPDAALEFFARVPDLSMLVPPEQKDNPFLVFARNVHVDKVHVFGGGVSFAGDAMRFRGAILGEATPETLFDIGGTSKKVLETQSVVGPGPIFTISTFDLAATYQLIRGALTGALTPKQSGNVMMVEGLAQGFLGMSLSDALGLFTGEFASEISFSEDGSMQRLFAVTIQKQQDVLRVLRAALEKVTVAEETSGGTTFLDVSYPSHDPVTGADKRNFYYAAVTPKMILVAPHKAMLREAIERMNSKPGEAPPKTILSNPEFARMRSLLPEKLSGIEGADFERVPWDKIVPNLAMQASNAAKEASDPNAPQVDWQKLIKLDIFSRHLHLFIGAWWKDSNGAYFDSYLQ